jgi:hypothetical protein
MFTLLTSTSNTSILNVGQDIKKLKMFYSSKTGSKVYCRVKTFRIVEKEFQSSKDTNSVFIIHSKEIVYTISIYLSIYDNSSSSTQ